MEQMKSHGFDALSSATSVAKLVFQTFSKPTSSLQPSTMQFDGATGWLCLSLVPI